MRWIWLAVLVACGDNVVPRLTPYTYDVDGVTFVSPGLFHDHARDEDCATVMWGDGATYCTPAIVQTAFADRDCTHEVAMAASGYVASQSSFGVHGLRAVAPRAALALYWSMQDGVCVGPYSGDPTAAWGDIVGDELDESAFVRLYRSQPEGNNRLQVIGWNTLDGLHVPFALYDRELKAECDFSEARDRDHVACMPADFIDTYFGDASCSVPVVVTPISPPAYARIQPGCDLFAPVGDEVAPAAYEMTANGCQAIAVPDGVHVYGVGPKVDLVDVTRERHGSGRIEAIDLVAGTARLPDGYLYDAMLDADCALALYDNALRCVPTAAPVSTYFTDDTCMTERDVAIVGRNACAAPERFAFGDAYRAVGPVVTDALYVPSTGDRCMLQPPESEAHAVGPVLPPETFVPAL